MTIQEAGFDGFWLDRLLQAEGIESHVVDAASVAVPRRRRRAKTDKIDGELLLRTLLAWLRGAEGCGSKAFRGVFHGDTAKPRRGRSTMARA